MSVDSKSDADKKPLLLQSGMLSTLMAVALFDHTMQLTTDTDIGHSSEDKSASNLISTVVPDSNINVKKQQHDSQSCTILDCDSLLSLISFGKYQRSIILKCGLSNGADSIEIICCNIIYNFQSQNRFKYDKY